MKQPLIAGARAQDDRTVAFDAELDAGEHFGHAAPPHERTRLRDGQVELEPASADDERRASRHPHDSVSVEPHAH